MKKSFLLACCLILFMIMIGAFIVPCTPPSKRAVCRKEMGRLRGYLLCDNFFGVSFFGQDFSSCTNGIEFGIGAFCDKVNQIARSRAEEDVFRVEQSSDGKGKVILDIWGMPYNFCRTSVRQKNQWTALRYSEVSNVVIWSSGPNKINEYGLNDDVVLRDRPYPQDNDN